MILSLLLTIPSLYSQNLKILTQDLDNQFTFHTEEHQSLLKALILLDEATLDTTNSQRIVLIDRNVFEIYLLNKIIHDTAGSISDFELNYEPEEGSVRDFMKVVRSGLEALSPEEKSRVQNLTFAAIDPVLGMQTSNEFRNNVLHLWADVFSKVPEAQAHLSLKAMRSFVRYQKLANAKSDSEEIPQISIDASFNAAGTLNYCLDSLGLFDSLSRIQGLEKEWNEIRAFIRLSNVGYHVYRDVGLHYTRMMETANYWLNNIDSQEIWIIEDRSEMGNTFKREYLFEDIIGLNFPSIPFEIHHFVENRSRVDTTGKIIHVKLLYDELLMRWPLADYNFSEDEVTVATDEITSSGPNSLQVFIGSAFNTAIVDDAKLNANFAKMGLESVNTGNAMGVELGVLGVDGVLFSVQWSGQNSWLDWDSRSHFAYTNFRFSSSVPLFNRFGLSSLLGVDYQYENYRIALPVNAQFIGNPQHVPVVLRNDGQNIGAFTQVLLQVSKFYAKAQLGYRWDWSDNRWYSNGNAINGGDNFRGSGLHYGLGLGFLIFGGNEK